MPNKNVNTWSNTGFPQLILLENSCAGILYSPLQNIQEWVKFLAFEWKPFKLLQMFAYKLFLKIGLKVRGNLDVTLPTLCKWKPQVAEKDLSTIGILISVKGIFLWMEGKTMKNFKTVFF